MAMRETRSVALLAWGNVLEDYLETIDVTLDDFCRVFTGSWMFGYVRALQGVGVRPVLMCVTAQVDAPTRRTHQPTGATIWLLPVPKLYRRLQGIMLNPYGRTVAQAFGDAHSLRRILFAILRELSGYLCTPPRALAWVLRREGCQVILCQEYEYPRFDVCVLLGRLLRLRIFGVFQGGDRPRSHLERILRPTAMRACTGIIIGARDEIRRVERVYRLPDGKVRRIFNPLDVEAWGPLERNEARSGLDIPRTARVVAWHGRISLHQKGLDLLLDAWKRVQAERSGDLRLLLVGTGEDAKALDQLIAAMRLQGVTWLNEFVSDREVLRRYLSAADLYAFPSRHEGFPVAPLEAMACGLPLVATDASGVADILEHHEAYGGVVVPRDDPAALAAEMGRLLDDQAWCRELGNRARRRVESSFSLDQVGRQLELWLFKDEERA